MKRFHVNIGVADIDRSIRFYTTLFGTEPTVLKTDYAKWMLDDPRINLSLSAESEQVGINHLGLQAESLDELAVIQSRLAEALEETLEQPDAECCYAHSSKTWVRDPDDIAWESFVTHGEITEYGDGAIPAAPGASAAAGRCCSPGSDAACCI